MDTVEIVDSTLRNVLAESIKLVCLPSCGGLADFYCQSHPGLEGLNMDSDKLKVSPLCVRSLSSEQSQYNHQLSTVERTFGVEEGIYQILGKRFW